MIIYLTKFFALCLARRNHGLSDLQVKVKALKNMKSLFPKRLRDRIFQTRLFD